MRKLWWIKNRFLFIVVNISLLSMADWMSIMKLILVHNWYSCYWQMLLMLYCWSEFLKWIDIVLWTYLLDFSLNIWCFYATLSEKLFNWQKQIVLKVIKSVMCHERWHYKFWGTLASLMQFLRMSARYQAILLTMH